MDVTRGNESLISILNLYISKKHYIKIRKDLIILRAEKNHSLTLTLHR